MKQNETPSQSAFLDLGEQAYTKIQQQKQLLQSYITLFCLDSQFVKEWVIF